MTDPVTVGPATKPETALLAPVRKTVTVAATKEHAFSVFTDGFATWWPLATHHVSEEVPETSVLEPFVGGRCYERCADGTECDWATSVYDPPDRLVIVWQLNTAFKFDTTITSEVEVRFVAEGPATTRGRARAPRPRHLRRPSPDDARRLRLRRWVGRHPGRFPRGGIGLIGPCPIRSANERHTGTDGPRGQPAGPE